MKNKNVYTAIGTGLPKLDRVLHGIMPGDMIVWTVKSQTDYAPFVLHFIKDIEEKNRKSTYFQFSKEPPYIPKNKNLEIIKLDPAKGFEQFLTKILIKIESSERGACFIFDNISELTDYWFSDRVIANLILLLGPTLYDIEATTYLAITRDHHMKIARDAIHDTAQVLIDIYNRDSTFFIHPKKVNKRYSDTLYMIHRWENDDFIPETNSSIITDILSTVKQPWLEFSMRTLDKWSRSMLRAQYIVNHGELTNKNESKELFASILKMAISKDKRFLKTATKNLKLNDLVYVGKRMVGTGLVGGKSAGMLLARSILEKSNPKWSNILEAHDSFFIGSDIFYSYLVENRCWWIVQKLRHSEDLIEEADDIKHRLKKGKFPADVVEQFTNILEYYGQSPIIVRSSSLMEDAYGNAFSGKYDSIFCTNQGTPAQRLEEFMEAVRMVYASTMKKETLLYRKKRNLLENDEQMALLVQRVSGERNGNNYFPHAAGVGFSFNPFVWNDEIDPHAGLLRLVFGLGTRAVDRSSDDYTRVIALNAPHVRPETEIVDLSKYSQHKVDLLDLKKNGLMTAYFEDVVKEDTENRLPMDLVTSRDKDLEKRALRHGRHDVFAKSLTFQKLIDNTNFINDMKELLSTLEKAYHYPVDIEFTVQFYKNDSYKINLVQCRPFQANKGTELIKNKKEISSKKCIFKSSGPLIGNSFEGKIDRLIYVVPSQYSKLNDNQRYSVAHLIGRLTHSFEGLDTDKAIMLIGPGRWGTTTPSLGVPVTFSEINTVSILCEMAIMHEGLIPDISLGTHFFNDLIEMDMLYTALYPGKNVSFIEEEKLLSLPNSLTALAPDYSSWENIVHVLDNPQKQIFIQADTLKQEMEGFLL